MRCDGLLKNARSGSRKESYVLSDGNQPKRNFSPKQGAEYLGIGSNLMYRMLAENRIPHARLGNRIVVSRAALDRLLAGDSVNATPA